jgi:hypothetical protein
MGKHEGLTNRVSCILGHTGHQFVLTPAQLRQRPGWRAMTTVKQHCIRLLSRVALITMLIGLLVLVIIASAGKTTLL